MRKAITYSKTKDRVAAGQVRMVKTKIAYAVVFASTRGSDSMSVEKNRGVVIWCVAEW